MGKSEQIDQKLKRSKNCLICRLNKDKRYRVDNGKFWIIDRPMDIELGGLFFLKTKRHLEDLGELTAGEKSELGLYLSKYAKRSKRLSKARRVIAMSLGLKDPHVHFWIIPYIKDNEKEILNISRAVGKLADKYRK